MRKRDSFVKKNKYSPDPSNDNSNNSVVNNTKTSHNIVKTYPALTKIRVLVMSTAKKLNHLRMLSGEIGSGYLFFGIVVSSFPETTDISWTNFELGHESKDIVKSNIGKD